MLIKKILVSFFLIINSNITFGQNYLWPTDASELISSSFCEFRPGHYHSAIDIKTWNREGYPCFAVEDGFIERIRISPFGYGKVLYLRLKDGNTAVYAHLQKFTEEIEQDIRRLQKTNKRYRIDWHPKNLEVKKGDIIAYTGRTGIGVPHLHFEIRDWKNNPVNPLQYYSIIKDGIRPRLKELLIIPMEKNSRVAYGFLPKTYPLKYIRNGIYVVKEPLIVKGKIGLALNGFDQADNASNKYGFYQTNLETDGTQIFQITYDKLNFSTTAHINTEIYYPFWVTAKKVFHKLFIEPFNPLKFYKIIPSADGTIAISDKPISFAIEVFDFHGNKSIVKGELLPQAQDNIQVENVLKVGNIVSANIKVSDISGLQIFTSKTRKNWIPAEKFETASREISANEIELSTKISLTDSTHNFMQIVLKSDFNQKIKRIVRLNELYGEDLDFRYNLHFLGNRLIFETDNYGSDLKLNIMPQNISIPLQQISEHICQALIPANKLTTDNFKFTFTNDQKVLFRDSLLFSVFSNNENTNINRFDSNLMLSASKGAVLDTTIIAIKTHQTDSIKFDIPVASKIFEINPVSALLYRSVEISIKADSLPFWGKWAICKINGRKKLSFINTQVDSVSLLLSARTKSFGRFIVASDTVPPIVDIILPQSGKVYYKNPEIKINLKDSLSGIGSEENIEILLNNKFVLFEWDPEDNLVTAHFDEPLLPGRYNLTIVVSDDIGNKTRRLIFFTVQ